MSNRKNILVIDDEEILLQIARDILTEFDFDVHTAGNGADGIRMYRDNADTIDLIILDMSLPGMSGTDVYEELRKINPRAKVLFSSGAGSAEDLPPQDGISFIPKPFSVMELVERVKEMIC